MQYACCLYSQNVHLKTDFFYRGDRGEVVFLQSLFDDIFLKVAEQTVDPS